MLFVKCALILVLLNHLELLANLISNFIKMKALEPFLTGAYTKISLIIAF